MILTTVQTVIPKLKPLIQSTVRHQAVNCIKVLNCFLKLATNSKLLDLSSAAFSSALLLDLEIVNPQETQLLIKKQSHARTFQTKTNASA